jgi:predicted phosphodiesterase
MQQKETEKPFTTKANLCAEYREKYGWEMPTLKLARIVYNDNKLLFTNVERVRDILRGIEGKRGKSNRRIIKQVENRPLNPYNLPSSDETIYEPFKINAKRLLVLSDIHIPYHSVNSLTIAFDWAKKQKPDAILLNGDTLDFFGLSRYAKDPKKRSFSSELESFKDFITILKKTFDAKIYFKIGNHEERYEHYLWMKAGELAGIDDFELANIIKARAEGIEIIADKRIMKAGELNIIHGHEYFGSFSPVNIARGLFTKGKVSAMQGHNHQTSEHTEADMNGKITTTWSVGCLSELHPMYMPLNKWNHGFAFIEIDGEDFQVQNKRIYKGKVL